MTKIIFVLLVLFGPADKREDIRAMHEMPNMEACIEQVMRVTQIKPPDKGVVFAGCRIEDLGATH